MGNEIGKLQDAKWLIGSLHFAAITNFKRRLPKTRISLIECHPKTGRMHQIRRHLAHLRYCIINDKPYGDYKVNKVFKEELGYTCMMLHTKREEFMHPKTDNRITIEALFFEEFER